jgi:hypothetical protein
MTRGHLNDTAISTTLTDVTHECGFLCFFERVPLWPTGLSDANRVPSLSVKLRLRHQRSRGL